MSKLQPIALSTIEYIKLNLDNYIKNYNLKFIMIICISQY